MPSHHPPLVPVVTTGVYVGNSRNSRDVCGISSKLHASTSCGGLSMLDLSRRRRTGTLASATAVAAAIVLTLAGASVSRAQMAVPGDFGNATPIAVTLSSYEINPSQLTLTHGVAYRLHLTNASGKAHNFAAPKLFAASSIAPADQSKIEDGKIEV